MDIDIDFGIPFTTRPVSFSFEYKYLPLEYGDGIMDEMDAYVILQVRENGNRYRLATGWLRSSEEKTNWTRIEIPLIYGHNASLEEYMYPDPDFEENKELDFYPDVSAKPTHLLIVFSSSAHGADLSSGAVGTTLDIKSLQLNY